MIESLYDISVKTIKGDIIKLEQFRGKFLLVVNVASQCGFTGQYEGLQKLFEEFKDRGFVILGFPCNQFGSQEPGSDSDVQSFCELKYRVSFPMFSKIEVNGAGTHPLYRFLKSKARGLLGTEAIKWNFTKFLVSRDAQLVERFAPTTTPETIAEILHKRI